MQRIPGARWLARLAESGIRIHVRNPAPTEKVEGAWQGCLMSHISTHMWTFMHTCTHTTHAQQKEKWNQVRPLRSEQAIRVLLATQLRVGIFMDYCQSRAVWKASLALVCVRSAYRVIHDSTSELEVPTSKQGVTHVFPHPLAFQSPDCKK